MKGFYGSGIGGWCVCGGGGGGAGVDITAIGLEMMQRCEPSICQPLTKDLATASLGQCLFIFLILL